MFFYSKGMNTWEITYGDREEDVTKKSAEQEKWTYNAEDGRLYTVEKFLLSPDKLIQPELSQEEKWREYELQGGAPWENVELHGQWPEEDREYMWQWVELDDNWVDQAGRWVDGYKEWARSQKKNDPFGEIRYFDLHNLDIPELGEQLEFDFVRQMEI